MNRKVLYVVSNPFIYERSPVGGYISHARGVTDGLREHGYIVEIVTDSPLHFIENGAGLKYTYYPLRSLRRCIPAKKQRILTKAEKVLFHIAMKKKLASLLNSQAYSFVYLRASYHGHIAVQIALKHSVPLVLEVNKPLSMGPYNRIDGLPWPKSKQEVNVPECERIQYEAASVITVDSPLRAQWILDFVDSKYEEKMVINPSGVDTKLFSPCGRGIEIREKMGFVPDSLVIGMASSFRWYNDIDEILEVFSEVKKARSEVVFLLAVGDPGRVGDIQEAMGRYFLENDVKLLVQAPFRDMPIILDACDILISLFNFHGKWPHNCSIKHMEYLAMGKPVVATRAGYANFAVEHGVNGLLVDEGDTQEFVRAILELAGNKNLRLEFGRKGREKAESELSWYENVSRFTAPLHG